MIDKIYFEVDSNEESEKIQKRLFELGYLWRVKFPPNVKELADLRALIIDPDDKRITYSSVHPEEIRRKDVTYIKGNKDMLFNSDIYTKSTRIIIYELQKTLTKKNISGIIHTW